MPRMLFAWIGLTDLRAPQGAAAGDMGPIAQAVKVRPFDEIHLLSNYVDKERLAQQATYLSWLKGSTSTPINVHQVPLTSPTNFAEIYAGVTKVVDEQFEARRKDCQAVFHLSPGTPMMLAVWVILAKTRYDPTELIQTSKEAGTESTVVPMELAADFLPDMVAARVARLSRLAEERPPEQAAFGDLLFRAQVMRRLVEMAQKAARSEVPVLIEGESGTGKELLARAIHKESLRTAGPFVAVNCGAIPFELVNSELFGHEAGAFTDARAQHRGFFEQAHGGTIFLDEIGELPLQTQVRLLRVLQERQITRVGGKGPLAVDFRVVAATNRSLAAEVLAGRFREDLYYRLAVATLKVPPLRERPGDLGMLLDILLSRVNQETGASHKKLSAGARQVMLNHDWPGNVRELQNTLRRAVLWAGGDSITAEDARAAVMSLRSPGGESILNQPLGDGFNLEEALERVARHYLKRAMEEGAGNKTKAAKLVGLASYQTLTNWLEKYGVN